MTMRLWLAVACAALVTACVSVLPEAGPAPNMYRLSGEGAGPAHTSADAAVSNEALVLIVHRPVAPSVLANDRIAVVRRDGVLAFASGARWTQTTPAGLGDVMFERLHQPGLSPVRPSDGVRGDVSLRIEIVGFEADFRRVSAGAGPIVRVQLRARLVDDDARVLLGATLIDVSEQAEAERLGAIVDAFNIASGRAAGELTDWIAATLTPAPE